MSAPKIVNMRTPSVDKKEMSHSKKEWVIDNEGKVGENRNSAKGKKYPVQTT